MTADPRLSDSPIRERMQQSGRDEPAIRITREGLYLICRLLDDESTRCRLCKEPDASCECWLG